MLEARLPTQAGAFYEANPQALKQQIKECFLHELGPGKIPEPSANRIKKVIGLICPHAGYMYSGPVAAHSYYALARDGSPDIVVVMGPNHTGYGSPLAIMNFGAWRTPLGDVEIDRETSNAIVKEAKIIDVDALAHRYEHSIEVQLPFLQFLYGSKFKIVPICFSMQDLESATEVGSALSRTLEDENAVIVASSDMSHYVSQKKALTDDSLALEQVEAMDEAKFFSVIEERRVTTCGYGPIMALTVAAKHLGAKEAKLFTYKTRGDVVGVHSSVVGYASVCFTK